MKVPRVKRSSGPKSKMTRGTYRKKALPVLMNDFEGRCAYCLDPSEFRHPNQTHVDHFNCKLNERRRHQYTNLMLACSACNLSKHDKLVFNPFDREQRLLNCTEESEFPEHIAEGEDGQWHALTKAGRYHLETVGLTESCHKQKRKARREAAKKILEICTTAVKFETETPAGVHDLLLSTAAMILTHLDNCPPMVADKVQTVREWLRTRGVDLTMFARREPSLSALPKQA
jgi:hypothetical protein